MIYIYKVTNIEQGCYLLCDSDNVTYAYLVSTTTTNKVWSSCINTDWKTTSIETFIDYVKTEEQKVLELVSTCKTKGNLVDIFPEYYI